MIAANELRTSVETLETKKNNFFVLVLFWTAILFRDTTLKFIWSLEPVARMLNLLLLVLLIGYAFVSISLGHYSKKGLVVLFAARHIDFWRNVYKFRFEFNVKFKITRFFWSNHPMAYLSNDTTVNEEKSHRCRALWRYYYHFMLWANILGILEYLFVFYGAQALRTINTPNGIFLAGHFSLFWGLADGSVHYRYYSCFGEPGTLAMFLLPAIAYAFFNRRYFGLPVFLIAFYLTDSLGGDIGLLMLIACIAFTIFNRNKKFAFFRLLFFLAVAALLWAGFGASLNQKLIAKGPNVDRLDSFTNTISNFPVLVLDTPFGIKLFEDTDSFFAESRHYAGANFMPGVYLQYGGICAFLGYLACLFISFLTSLRFIKRGDLSVEGRVVFTSILVLLPFIFQRTTIWESSLFAFLFTPSILKEIGIDVSPTVQRQIKWHA